MTANSEEMVPQVQHDFQNLLAYITCPEAQSQTAYTVELTLFRRLLALGAALWRLFVVTRAAVRPAGPVLAPDGMPLRYHEQRPTTDDSVFGNVRFGRHSFTAPGQEGICPLAAELSLPARCDSDLLCEWVASGTADASYRERHTVLERLLGVSLSVPAMEASVADAASEVTALYAQPADPPAPAPEAMILVVQADGKGVPMVQPSPGTPLVRLGKGQKRGKKKEAVVTGLYTVAPYRRTPQEVVAALLPEPGRPAPSARPVPVEKELHATLEGKAVAMIRLVQRVATREGPPLQPRVALTDGAEALQEQVVTHVPAHTRVLDIIHTTEYLGATATALLGETHPHRTAWVRSYLEPLVAGQTDAVMTALEAQANDPMWTAPQRQAVRRPVGYDRRNRPYMRYDAYLAQGWPIGTGVIEGACRHLVKDRMELSGMRWTNAGAQAVLDLRAVRVNAHWERYGPFHRQQQHHRLSGSAAPVPEGLEGQALQLAA